MESNKSIKFVECMTKDPDTFLITRNRVQNGVICYTESIFQKNTLINSLVWIYQNYFLKSVTVFLPKMGNNPDYLVCDLESLEQTNIQTGTVVIFGYADLIFGDLVKINKRRLNTILKSILKRCTVVILSSCSLKVLDLQVLDYGTTKESFDYLELEKPMINYRTLMDYVNCFDLMDPKNEDYQNNVEPFVEMVSSFVKDGKRVYISLNLITSRLLEIESLLKDQGCSVLRKDSDSSDIVINSAKTCCKKFLIGKYDIYIFAPAHFDNSIEAVSQFKSVLGNNDIEIYLDSTKYDNIEKSLKELYLTSHVPRTIIKDSQEFDSYTELVETLGNKEIVLASDENYTFQSSPEIQEFDLQNLQKKEYDKIRDYVKVYLLNKYDIEIKTCQLAAPCSPKDRSKKLNSLSNKISSFDYRCDCTCEIFKDYSIGVIIWNETFANRKTLNLKMLKNCCYIYQTTYGKWKYTVIN